MAFTGNKWMLHTRTRFIIGTSLVAWAGLIWGVSRLYFVIFLHH